MKSIVTLFLAFFLFSFINAQQQIIVQDGNETTLYTNLDTAVAMAPSGAYVYLPGGYFNVGSGLIVDKKLNIIGAGHYPDSTLATGRTVISGDVKFIAGSNNSTIEGIFNDGDIRFGTNSTNDGIVNILIKRIYTDNIYLGYNDNLPNSKDIFIKDCVIKNLIIGTRSENVTISNNILGIAGSPSYIHGIGGSQILNNIIFRGTGSLFSSMEGCNIYNNIFITSSTIAHTNAINNVFRNNISSGSTSNLGNNISLNNQFGVDLDIILTNQTVNTFNYSDDYHIQSGSIAEGGGVNGTDIGIYGGQEPYKEGAVPHNPHIQFSEIPSITDPQGNLQIHIKVKAQGN